MKTEPAFQILNCLNFILLKRLTWLKMTEVFKGIENVNKSITDMSSIK